MSHRILFVIESLFPLGAAQQLFGLAQSLAIGNHEIEVAVLGKRNSCSKLWTEAGIKVHYLNGDDQTPLHTMRDGFQVLKNLRARIRSLSPEIVHAWCGHAELFTLLATQDFPITRRMNQVRLICTELFLQPEKRFSRQASEKWLTRRVETMVVPHHAIQSHLAENGYGGTRIEIIPNAVVTPDPVPDSTSSKQDVLQKLDLPPSTLLAGSVAPLAHRTRLKDLIWATDLLTCIRPDLHFIIIGTGTQRHRLKRFAALTEARSHVHLLGEPDGSENIVAALDVYWHSHFRDPLSGNLLAAMASGVPAVSVFGPGTQEIIRHQETGFAVNIGARDEFARWTKFLIEQSASARKLARQGQTFVQSNFEKTKMVDAYLNIYDRQF